MTLDLPRTGSIITDAEYFSTPASFFGHFAAAWDAVRCQVVKLETRQFYHEADNPSFEALLKGDLTRAIALLPEVRAVDDDLYLSLRQRQVDFTRCRPLKFPLSDYLRWELAAYDLNSSKGERVFCCHYNQLDVVFSNFAKHDFMVFDSRFAFIHDYDEDGRAIGGWTVTSPKSIQMLLSLFSFIKANCRPHGMFK